MKLDLLLAPVSDSAPCGENLEYSAPFMQLQSLARGRPEQQYGSTLIAAELPDWRQVEQLATQLLTRSKDLRLMLFLTHAWTAQHGLVGYADGLGLIAAALERYWPGLWPSLEWEGQRDPLMRINVLRALGDDFPLAQQLRDSDMIRSNGLKLSIAAAAGCLNDKRSDDDSFPGGWHGLQQAIEHDGRQPARTIAVILGHIEQIFSLLRQHLGEGALPVMPRLLNLLQPLALAAGAQQTPTADSDSEAGAPQVSPVDDDSASAVSGTGPVRPADGEIHRRDQARLALEKVRRYFLRYEPGHPAPLLIARLLPLMEQDFITIIRELAPQAVEQFENLLGRPERSEAGTTRR